MDIYRLGQAHLRTSLMGTSCGPPFVALGIPCDQSNPPWIGTSPKLWAMDEGARGMGLKFVLLSNHVSLFIGHGRTWFTNGWPDTPEIWGWRKQFFVDTSTVQWNNNNKRWKRMKGGGALSNGTMEGDTRACDKDRQMLQSSLDMPGLVEGVGKTVSLPLSPKIMIDQRLK